MNKSTKRISLLFFLCIIFMGLSSPSAFGQGAQDTFTVSGQVVQQITITPVNAVLNFGKFTAATNATTGSVSVSAADGSISRAGDVAVTLQGGLPTRATFNVGGQNGLAFSIFVDEAAANTTVTDGGGHSMAIIYSTSPANGTVLAAPHLIGIGGTLTVGDATANPAGTYAAAGTNVPVRVDYD
ncbi:MAG: hypothetical protein ACD_39C01627G0003 [uncultured bacterium]|nr:MAG: hypothetical protein ACD_39C01627G0003 [uncultured bacterium]